MKLQLSRYSYVHRHLRFDELTAPSTLYTLSVFAIGLAVLCVPATATAATIVVNPGESIQQAVDNASPGDKIVVKPGTYQETHGGTEAVLVNKDGIRLIARSNVKKGKRVILVPGPGNQHGIVAKPDPGAPDIEGYRIQGFTVQGFPNNGIKTEHVNNFKILRNESIDNLENGIQPELSANGLVRRNLSYGSDDSALWVEGSVNVRVVRNVTHSSPTGIEVTVSDKVVVKRNESYNNAVGIGLYHPSAASVSPLARMANWKVEGNYVHDNNRPNSAPPGSMAADLPPGGGILVLGVDETLIQRNQVENNDFYGMAVIDYCLAVGGTSFNCTDNPPAVDPVPELNRFVRNTFVNNGTAPDPSHPLAAFAADIVYVILPGRVTGNCFDRNIYTTYSAVQGVGPPQCP